MTAQHFKALADTISKMDLNSNDREFNSAFKADLFLWWSRGFHA